jgi:CBS domain-containing protein
MLGLSARDIMTREVITVRKGASIEQALMLMADNNVSGLIVVDQDGLLEGIITEKDVLLKGQAPVEKPKLGLYGPWMLPDEVIAEMYRRARSTTVEEAMTRQVVAYSEDSAVTDIARAMMEHNINRVPIIADRKVIGIVSRGDIVRAMSCMINGCVYEPDTVREGKVIELK